MKLLRPRLRNNPTVWRARYMDADQICARCAAGKIFIDLMQFIDIAQFQSKVRDEWCKNVTIRTGYSRITESKRRIQ